MSYRELLLKSYNEVIDILKKKYGPVSGDYFCNENCKSRNAKISRTNKGLVVHHIKEDTALLLSDSSQARKYPFEYQKAENLVYCNYLEHLILHILIFLNNSKLSLPGIQIIYRDINSLYLKKYNNVKWKVNCYKTIATGYIEYLDILYNIVQKITLGTFEELSEINFNKDRNMEIYKDLFKYNFERKEV